MISRCPRCAEAPYLCPACVTATEAQLRKVRQEIALNTQEIAANIKLGEELYREYCGLIDALDQAKCGPIASAIIEKRIAIGQQHPDPKEADFEVARLLRLDVLQLRFLDDLYADILRNNGLSLPRPPRGSSQLGGIG